MKHEQATDEMTEKAALYALDALSQIEAKAFEMHLAEGCEACRSELLHFEEVVGLIGIDANEVQPPAHLRGRVVDRIQHEEQPLSGLRSVEPRPTRTVETKTGKNVRRTSYVLPWAVAASVAVIAAVSLLLWRDADHRIAAVQQEFQIAQENYHQIQTELGKARDTIEEEDAINKAIQSPGSSKLELAANDPAAGSDKATVYWNKRDREWVVTASLAPAPTGKVYQLWFVTPNQPMSAGLIKTDASGHGFLVTNVPSDVNQIAAAAITLEPHGGSVKPTMPILVVGKTS